jgi:hypothetical protein
MHEVSGGCHCGNIRVELQLARAPASYQPRACDCDFCRKHAAAYVSDPEGSLLVRIRQAQDAGKYVQGSAQAEMLLCRNCGVLVGALYAHDGRVYASVSARVIEGDAKFAPDQPVSPKALTAREKVQRWRDIWFRDVRIRAGD